MEAESNGRMTRMRFGTKVRLRSLRNVKQGLTRWVDLHRRGDRSKGTHHRGFLDMNLPDPDLSGIAANRSRIGSAPAVALGLIIRCPYAAAGARCCLSYALPIGVFRFSPARALQLRSVG